MWDLSGNELTRNSSGNSGSQSSQLVEQLWIDPGLKSGISAGELISTLKKKKAQAGNELSNILPNSSQARKKPRNKTAVFLAIKTVVLHIALSSDPCCSLQL